MAITLTKGLDSITLPPDLIWEDELRWSPVAQSKERSITGAWLVDSQVRDGGRPITLVGRENAAWLQRLEALGLRAWLALPGQVFTLTLNGTAYSVMFDHGAEEVSNAFEVTPVVEYCDPEDGDYLCNVVLRFFTV